MNSISKIPLIIKLGLLIVLIGLAVLFFYFSPEQEEFFPQCPMYSLTGFYCPGCGSQRAIHHLLHFNIYGVVSNNFLFIPAILIIVYGLFLPEVNRIFRKQYKNLLYHKCTPIIILLIVLLFWILRNIPVFPFSVLAPN